VSSDFIAHLWVLLTNKNVKWSADEKAETNASSFLASLFQVILKLAPSATGILTVADGRYMPRVANYTIIF
jgi:hypothetical protein